MAQIKFNINIVCYQLISIQLIIIPKKEMSFFKDLIDERDYCEEADLLVNQYAHSPLLPFEAQQDFIAKWLLEQTSTPLIITGEEESGKKTLLCSFLKASQQQHKNWLHIYHFSSITPNYSHILYKTMVELRNFFKIEQRVDLNEEKLRRYFKYWLQVTSDFIEKEYLGYSRSEVPKVVIVIEGVDDCLDFKGNPVQTEFWLPSSIPKNIKLILTTKILQEGKGINATILRHHLSSELRSKIMDKFCSNLKEQYRCLSLYQCLMLSKMLTIQPLFSPKNLKFKQIICEYIGQAATKSLSSDEVKSLLYILTLTRKGLKAKWILNIVNITQQKWQMFLRYFSFLIVESKGYFIICSKSTRLHLKDIVDFTGEKLKTYRQSIAKSIRNEAVHLRELQEMVYQLYVSDNFIQLKEVISRVQNFMMLYTPLSKDLLCQCWVKLEQLEQYDPVFEYNKAIENFTSHYYPKEEDLYRLIFQICMFFKEYSEFENARTPEFRHPLIKGQSDQLLEIGIFDELKNLGMIGKCKINKLKPLQKFNPSKLIIEVIKKKLDNKDSKRDILKAKAEDRQKRPKEQHTQSSQLNKSSYKANKILQKASEICDQEQQSRPLTSQQGENDQLLQFEPTLNIQELNVSIQSNQEKFRLFFTNKMKEYLQNYFIPFKKSTNKEKELSFESEESDNDEQCLREKGDRELKIDIEKLKEALILKRYREYLEESYHKSGQEVRFYYYKQWIWLQFPWICQTVRNIYSQMIKQCLPGSIHFMSPIHEFKLIKEVIKIAHNAKDNKIAIFTEKKIEIIPIKYSAEKMDSLMSQKKEQKLGRMTETSKAVGKIKRSPIDLGLSKCKLDLSNIQEIIAKEKEYEHQFKSKMPNESRLRGQNSSPNLFITEMGQKQSKFLPKLQKSKFGSEGFAKQPFKQNLNESRDCTLVIKRFNQIKHENDMLIQKIEEMKRLEVLQVDRSKEEQSQIGDKIRILQAKTANLQKHFKGQEDLRKKLEIIIKVCDLNKMYGSESEYLSTYLASLKQMIILEQGRVNEQRDKIVAFVEKSKDEVKELRQRRKHMKNDKDNNNLNFMNIHSNSTNPQLQILPLEEIEEQLRGMDRDIKRSRCVKERSKKEIFLSSEDYDMIEQKFGIFYGESNNENKIKQFADKIDKKKLLVLKNEEISKESKLNEVKLESTMLHLKNMREAHANEKNLKVANDLIERRKQLTQVRKRNLLLTQSIQNLQAN